LLEAVMATSEDCAVPWLKATPVVMLPEELPSIAWPFI
jgi:hypothetical protein